MATDIKNDANLGDGSLVSVWMSDSSGLTTDLHGTNTLTNVGSSVSLTTGQQGDAGDYVRATPSYQTASDSASLSITGDISIAFWINLDLDVPNGNVFNLVDKGNTGAASNRAYSVFMHESSGSNLLNLVYWSTVQTRFYTTAEHITTAAGWQHVVITADVSVPTVTMYIDGSSVSLTTAASSATSINDTANGLGIGASNAGAEAFDGQLNQVCIWSKVLTGSDVTALYNSGSGIPYESSGAAEQPAVFFGANF